jgi:hypothetical protein
MYRGLHKGMRFPIVFPFHVYYNILYMEGGVTMSNYPDWVNAFKEKGTSVKKVGNEFYLYHATSKRIWDVIRATVVAS